MKTNQEVNSGRHQIAHSIGHAGYAHYHDNAAQALAHGSMTCWSGYYHGVVERAFAGVPRAKVASLARKLCTGSEINKTYFLLYQCVHGLGHGLMIYSLNDSALFAQGLRPARDGLGSNLLHRRRLHAELPARADADRADEVAEQEADLLYPCDKVAVADKPLLLPDGDVEDPAGRPLRLPQGGRMVPEGRDGLGRDVLPVLRP